MKQFVLTEPTGKYFVNPSYESWSFTSEIDQATMFQTLNEANKMKDIIKRAVQTTYWDYSDIIPYPEVKELNLN